MQDLIITAQGKDLITKLIASATKATFTRVVTSNKKYTNAQAGNLTTIQNIQQSKAIDSVYITSDTKLIEAYVKFDNTLVTSGYQVQTVGVYAQETGGTEILYAVSLADSNVDYMPAYDGNNPTAITFRLNVRVENNANVEITIDPAGSASNEALQAVKDSLTTTINSVNTTITTNLNNEINTRKAETSSLTSKLTTETNERKGADTSLQSNIDKEATTRANADTAINTKLDPIKELIDTVFLGEIVKANDRGIENNKYKPICFGTVNYPQVGLGTAGDGNTTWHKEAVKVLYTRLKDKGYKGDCLLWGCFKPAQTQWVIGSMALSSSGTYEEDATGYPKYCQFISLTYGGGTMYRFGMKNGTWYFETTPTTTQVNTLISNAKTALETAYKNADSTLSTNITNAYTKADSAITTAYKNADTNNFNTLTTNYKNADTVVTNAYKAADQTNFNTLTTNYKNADSVLQTNIDNEATARANGDSNLQGNINTLTNRLNNISISDGNPYIVLPAPFMVHGGWGGKGIYDGVNNVRNTFAGYAKGIYPDTQQSKTFVFTAHIGNVGIAKVTAMIYQWDIAEAYKFDIGGGASISGAVVWLIKQNASSDWYINLDMTNARFQLTWVQSSENMNIIDYIGIYGPSINGWTGQFTDGPAGVNQLFNYSFYGHYGIHGSSTSRYFNIIRMTVLATTAAGTQVSGQILGKTYVREIFQDAWNGSWQNIG